MSSITINGNTFNPASPAVQPLGLLALDAAASNYIIVQTKEGRLDADQTAQLTAHGVQIHEYVSENTYLCGYKPKDLKVIRNLPFISYANVYLPLFVVDGSLKSAASSPSVLGVSRATTASRTPRLVDVVFHKDIEENPELKQEIAAAAHIDPDTLKVSTQSSFILIYLTGLGDWKQNQSFNLRGIFGKCCQT
jgi:serine protease AprX